MKKLKNKIIELKITNCNCYNHKGVWWSNKIGQTLLFWKKPFTDDSGILSIWAVEKPANGEKFLGKYIYLKCTNYDMYIRKTKLEKICRNKNPN